ncbi:MerR family DNA-binding transcriptional regulator, partial [Gottfriedia acidiceleris]
MGIVYKIGELAKEVGVSKRTIDYYTNLGLL